MNEDLKNAIEVLKSGGLILYPTDTIWGIGCDATNIEAVKKIYALKNRTDSKTMIILIDNENRLIQYVKEIPEIAWQLIEVSDKPLTIIYPGAKNLASNLIAENGSIAIRVVKDEFCRNLISRFKKPIVSTSANFSGESAPENFINISEGIKEGVDYIINWRQNELTKSKPSSIIELGTGGQFKIIRQ